MESPNERMQILEMIESGRISAEEGLRMLAALSETTPDIETALDDHDRNIIEEPREDTPQAVFQSENMIQEQEISPKDSDDKPEAADREEPGPRAKDEAITLPSQVQEWPNWWVIPVWIGIGITLVSGLAMFWVLQTASPGLWFVCASVPFILGILVILLAWQSRTALWLHLRVTQKPGEKPERIAISLPIPIRPTIWLFRTFGDKIPQLEGTSLDEVLLAIGESASSGNPIYIAVDEGEGGEKVEIYIG